MSNRHKIYVLVFFILFGFDLLSAQGEESLRADTIRDLIGVLDSRNWDRAVEELVKIGEPAVDPLLLELRSHSRFTSPRSCYALTRIGTQEAVEAVMEVLKNTQSPAMVREYAAHALAERESGWMAATALGDIQSREALEPLRAALESDDLNLRRASVWALEKMPSFEMVIPLIELLDDKDWDVRMWAVWALEKIGTPEALKAIKKFK